MTDLSSRVGQAEVYTSCAPVQQCCKQHRHRGDLSYDSVDTFWPSRFSRSELRGRVTGLFLCVFAI